MEKIGFLLLTLTIGCISPPTKMEIIEMDRKITENTFQYIPESSDIDIRFEIIEDNLVGKLYRKEKVTTKISKKEVKSFDYDEKGNFKNDFWAFNSLLCLGTFCLNIPFAIYEYYSVKATLGEKRKFEEIDIKKKDFGKFNSDLFQEDAYFIRINDDKKIKVKDSAFTISLNYFLKRKDEGIEYKIYYQEKDVVKSETLYFADNTNKIMGTSPKYKQLLVMIEEEKKKREMEAEREKEREEKLQSCEGLKIGWESHYSNSSPSDYFTICNYLCARTCRDSSGFGTFDFKKCNSDCKNNCKTCFK